MEKRKRIEAELQLPEAIIQHIQSFLDGKAAAQTTLLSKSWCIAWLTRPNLDFDQKLFDSENSFWEFMNKTVERYEKPNLKIKIDSLRLWIQEEHPLVNQLIIKALNMGATSLDFKIYKKESEFDLSHQVFGFENLTKLSVSGCKIGVETYNKRLISCLKLKSLSLEKVYGEGDIIWDIITSCPLIENFSLSTTFYWRPNMPEFGKQNGVILLNEFHKMKCLHLYRVRIDPSYFDNFSCKFPCLEDLALNNCDCSTDIQISSPSLQGIDFTDCYHLRRLKFDVPRVHKFTFSGPNIPFLSFKTTTNKWKSDISIERRSAPSAKWFLNLGRLVLTLNVWSDKPSVYTGVFLGLRNKPEVDHVMINGPYSFFPDFYSCLFKCCRPICLNHLWCPRWDAEEEDDSMESVWIRKMQQACMHGCIAYQNMTNSDLKKVKLEFYDESISEWRSNLLDTTSLGIADLQEYVFSLKWRH